VVFILILRMRKLFILFLTCIALNGFAQKSDKPFIKLVQPLKEKNSVRSSTQFVIGSVCKSCSLTIDDVPVHVYPTGGFAYQLNLTPGDAQYEMVATNPDGKSTNKKINYSYSLPQPPDTVKTLSIESIQTFPDGDLELLPGDKIEFKVKTLTRCTVKAGDIPLYEMPTTQTKGIPGIYQGEYILDEADSFANYQFPITATDSSGRSISKETTNSFSVFTPDSSNIAITQGRLAYLEYGLGDDRLGGAKIGYLDSNVVLNITGKIGSHYRVKLSNTQTAYIEDDQIKFLGKGTFVPHSLTSNFLVYGDDKFDYVEVDLSERLPYQSFQLIDPSKIVVDIYGATNNTNWIKQFEDVKEIKNIYYEQIAENVFRITIELNHPQPWGYQLYYKGNKLVIKIKQQPKDLSLKNMTIAIDAGHGGTNNGAVGPTGVYEKDLTLAIALKLQKTLQATGAKVIMTRTKEEFFDNRERILFYRDSMPDLLLSIHLNSADDPINISGTSSYYRYIGFRPLSADIYKRMLELGLKEYGNTGSFNFMLNSPTEYPNALIETLFLSNPAEEAKALDENFQQQMVDKIVLGLNDFLANCRNN
jgi:N-acetylmuramoyl-L-alanine amidase